MRAPVVLGLAPRVGASTIAAALRASERPPLVTGGPTGCCADIAVCAGDEASLRCAEALRGAAVLLVVLVDDTAPPTHARQRELAQRHAKVVVLPHAPGWAGLPGVPDEAAALLAQPPEQLAPALGAYTRGLRLAVAALLRAGALDRPQPPTLTWSPRTAGPPPRSPAQLAPPLRRATPPDRPADPLPSASRACGSAGPITVRPTRAGPAPAGASSEPAFGGATQALELDDDAIEAEVLAAVERRSAQTAVAARPLDQSAGTADPAAGPLAAARTSECPATDLRVRALHRPVMGPVRVDSAKAG